MESRLFCFFVVAVSGALEVTPPMKVDLGRAFRERFATSPAIYEASMDFILVNCHDEDDPTKADGERFSPDGGYVPRVLFFDADGDLMDVHNKGKTINKYYYPLESELLAAMYEARRQAYQEDNVCAPLPV
ncbi:unnamed protein product [Darwinula stevensoni]|uniref:Selenoprotein P N-terminal domain-containing protein n=1 Tax=Darwinula stevensoni TaxID=69355 RepID=A0A7R8ZYM8_9CRUS|nr:unnamed protein product [Darwinula stevensoni]CAG0880866.1 unnamed protein product [Darwinula stevensoni]